MENACSARMPGASNFVNQPSHLARSSPGNWITILAVGVLFAAACGGGNNNSAGTILLGATGPLSQPGDVAAGVDMKWAIETAVADVNAKGGVLGKKLVLDFEDTANKPEIAGAVAQKFADEHVAAMVGEFHSGAALAMIPTLEKYNVPAVFADTVADAITGGNGSNLPANPHNIFRLTRTATQINQAGYEWVTNGLHKSNPTVLEIYEATDYGLSVNAAWKAQAATYGAHLFSIQVQLNQPDYTSIVTRAAQDHPNIDLFVNDTSGNTTLVLLENAYRAGLVKKGTPAWLGGDPDINAYWRVVPDGIGTVDAHQGLLPSQYNAVAKSIETRFKSQFNDREAEASVYEGYDTVLIAADAIQRAGGTTADAVIKALESTHLVGSQGEHSFLYGSSNPVPSDKPSWTWHQWLDSPQVIVELTKKGQLLADGAVVWPPKLQTQPGVAYVEVLGG